MRAEIPPSPKSSRGGHHAADGPCAAVATAEALVAGGIDPTSRPGHLRQPGRRRHDPRHQPRAGRPRPGRRRDGPRRGHRPGRPGCRRALSGQPAHRRRPGQVVCISRRGVDPRRFTASEVLSAWRAGAVVVKLFPAGSVGPAYIKDLLGPLRHIPLLPTGGHARKRRQFPGGGRLGSGHGLGPGQPAAGRRGPLRRPPGPRPSPDSGRGGGPRLSRHPELLARSSTSAA